MNIKSHKIFFIFFILFFNFTVKAQVVVLNEKNINNRVFYPDDWDAKRSEYYHSVAEFIDNYSRSFHSTNHCPIYIRFQKNTYFVGVDNHYRDYNTELIFNSVREREVGLYLIFPDTCMEFEQFAKLVDLGFQNFCILKECKILSNNLRNDDPEKYIDLSNCELTDLIVRSALNCDLSRKKNKFVNRYFRKQLRGN